MSIRDIGRSVIGIKEISAISVLAKIQYLSSAWHVPCTRVPPVLANLTGKLLGLSQLVQWFNCSQRILALDQIRSLNKT